METPLPSAPKPKIQVMPWYTLGGAGVLGLAVVLSVRPDSVQAAGLTGPTGLTQGGAPDAPAARPARRAISLSAPVATRAVGASLSTVPGEISEPLQPSVLRFEDGPSVEDESGLR